MTLSQKIVILRKTKGITQDEFARALDVSRQSVHKWESGQCYPEVPKIIKMKELFGISIDDLLDDSFEIPMPEKKKRRTSAKTEADVKDTKEKNEANDGNTGAPVLNNSSLPADDGIIEEIKVEVIEKTEPEVKEAKISAELTAEQVSAVNEEGGTEQAQDERRKGFFSKIFGRKR